MQFDANNPIIKLCAEGMEREGSGKKAEALTLFQRAWDEATNDFERFTSAHYVARHQDSIAGKLMWDQTALQSALKISDETIKKVYPSLYLNIAKCHEDLGDYDNAGINYNIALSYAHLMEDDGYGNMIKAGIIKGIERVKQAFFE